VVRIHEPAVNENRRDPGDRAGFGLTLRADYFFFLATFLAIVFLAGFFAMAERLTAAFLPDFLAEALRPAGRLELAFLAAGFRAEAFLAFFGAGLAATGGTGETTTAGLKLAAGAGIGAVIMLLV
jgi:hypothetical protein